MKLRVDLSGKRFGKLTVVELSHRSSGKAIWKCLCDCGSTSLAQGYNLTIGHTSSCGCQKFESNKAIVTHGKSSTKSHAVWRRMRQRCTNPRDVGYKDYGGRGIVICDRWDSFESFYLDMGDPPEGMTIDRIDVNGNYEPGNCRWADDAEQSNNRRCVTKIEKFGRKQTISEWSKELGLSRSTIVRRMEHGWPMDRVLDPPVIQRPYLRTRAPGPRTSK